MHTTPLQQLPFRLVVSKTCTDGVVDYTVAHLHETCWSHDQPLFVDTAVPVFPFLFNRTIILHLTSFSFDQFDETISGHYFLFTC